MGHLVSHLSWSWKIVSHSNDKYQRIAGYKAEMFQIKPMNFKPFSKKELKGELNHGK